MPPPSSSPFLDLPPPGPGSEAPPSVGLTRCASPIAPSAVPPTRPTPLPKRPKGRWFVAVLLLGACYAAAHQVWQAYFRYQAYGTVTGKVVQLSPPWDGVLVAVHVKEGQEVRQGDPLVTLES